MVLRRTPLLLSLAIAFLCGAPALSAAPQWDGPGDDPPPPTGPPPQGNGPIRAHGDTDFNVWFDTLKPPLGDDALGFVYSSRSQAVWHMLEDVNLDSGIARVNVRIDLGDNPGNKGESIALAKAHGMKVLMTVVGTPYNNASEYEGPNMGGRSMPPWARSVPANRQAWANNLSDWLTELQDTYGVLPDFVELWTEVDREEWWSGSLEEYLQFFKIVNQTLAPIYGPQGVKFGGAGFASQAANMGGDKLATLRLGEFAAAHGLRLDFLSWHQYQMGSAHLYFNTTEKLRAALDDLGLHDTMMFCSEWNLFPGAADSPRGIELDGAHAAANYAVFHALSDHPTVKLDYNATFMLKDQGAQGGLADLTGRGHGLITKHGIKKPIFRIMEFINSMKNLPRVKVNHPHREYSATVAGARNGNTVLLIVANDVQERVRFWAMAARERGMLPGYVGRIVQRVGFFPGNIPGVGRLMDEGLTEYEAIRSREIIPLIFEVDDLQHSLRDVVIRVQDTSSFTVSRVWRFDSAHNNPAARRNELESLLQEASDLSKEIAWQGALDAMATLGVNPPNRAQFEACNNAQDLADLLGIPFGTAQTIWQVYLDQAEEGLVAMEGVLNSQPATMLTSESAAAAGVTKNGNTLTVTLEPDSVSVLEIQL